MSDLRWKMVTCMDCGKEYRCTPDTDYYHERGTLQSARTPTSGRCWRCHLLVNGLNPDQPEPAGDVLT